jgi:DNA adenine methylase
MGQVIEMNGLSDGHYVEPFAGGAGIAISLLFLEFVRRIHLNDINLSVYAFWYSVLKDTDNLCRLIQDTEVTIDEWDRQRAIQQQYNESSTLELGFSTFFLNRTNRSGIIRGGVIGGRNQSGNWKLDARYNKTELIRRIRRIAEYSGRISLTRLDAERFIVEQLPQLPKRTLVYLDPPYYVNGRGLYEDHYSHEDHNRISQLIRTRISQQWVVSYDNHTAIHELYNGFRQQTYGLHYSANDRYRGTEIMVFCDGLKVPAEIKPSRSAIA